MKINIIGAGVAGLSAGCYLQMNGFETTIFEKHTTFGGLCTGWKRNGYTFESGFQWLLGSGHGSAFYQLWSELMNLEAIRFIQHEVRMEIEVKNSADPFGDHVFHLYTNLYRLETYLLSIAPEDKRVIRRWIRTMRRMQTYEIPPMIKVVPELLPWYKKIGFIKHLPLLIFLTRIKRETNFDLADKFKNTFLKEAFRLLFDGEELSMLILSMPLAFNDKLGTGYPVGGSVGFVGNLERKYRSLGGTIRYQCEVEKIVVRDHQACGLLLKTGESIPSDITISAADWKFTYFKALEGKYVNKTIDSLHLEKTFNIYYSVFMVSIGVADTFLNHPHFLRFPVDEPLSSPDGTTYERMEMHINNYDPTSAPEGKTVISLSFYTRNADYWIQLRRENLAEYQIKKQQFAATILEHAFAKLEGLRENTEVVDIATPATFQRYTNNWKGSVQGWLPGINIIARSPVKSQHSGLRNFYHIGHWTIPGGGLPVAIKSARDVAQIICHQENIPFRIVGDRE